MNSDDLLTRATRALREASPPDDELDAVAASTLARVERSSKVQRRSALRQRTFTRWVVMPIAASFLVFCAWASASGRLSRWVSLRSHDDSERALHAPSPPPATPALATPPLPSPVIEPSAEVAVIDVQPEAAVIPKPSPKPPVDVDALYRDAHDAHFVRRDPGAALAAWDRYLAAAGPSGRFTLEARYNRAISLVRLGRKTEAAEALRPFARGDYGGYRREEAEGLLRTLE